MTFRFRLLAALLGGLLLTQCVMTAAPADFEQANRFYEQGRFPEAVAAYTEVISSGKSTAHTWFNLGNAAYKSGQLGRSIAAYRMAERLTPRDAALRANLQFVRGKVYADERPRVPMWKSAVRLATINEWTVLTVVFCWAGFAVLAWGEVTRRRYTKTAVCLLLLSTLSGVGLGTLWQDQVKPGAVVVAREAVVRFGPLDESQTAFQLRDGVELDVTAEKGDWLQIRDAEKRAGWIRRDEVALLPSVSRS
jgi:tetratricopeptide (TPR) repeat protein